MIQIYSGKNMSRVAFIPQAEVENVITNKIAQYTSMMEVNTQIINDTTHEIEHGLKDLLKEGGIDKARYKSELKQNKDELGFRLVAKAELEQQLERFNQLQTEARNQTPCFVIDSGMSKDELHKLIVLTQIKIDSTQDKNEQLFLNTILQTAEACKNHLKENRALQTQTIPMLDRELEYANNLLNAYKSPEIEHYIDTINSIKNASSNEEFSNIEQAFVDNLCEKVTKEINNAIISLYANIPVDEKKLQKNVEAHIEKTVSDAQKIPLSTGFRGFINRICDTFHKKPVFHTTVDNPEVFQIARDFKERLNLIKNQPEPLEDEMRASMR